ncbi:MAG: type III polyketide synthase [Phycisphaerales bacterium]
MTAPAPFILGIGTAVPEGTVGQEEALALARVMDPVTDERRLSVLYRNSRVRRRGSVLFRPAESGPHTQSFYTPAPEGGRGAGTAARLSLFAAEATPLAARACTAALGDARTPAGAITHLITVSCTGFAAPGLDVLLIKSLGLSPAAARTNVAFMGCHGAVNGLRIAAALARAGERVLLCALELCSLHYQYHAQGGQSVANALFSDGAAAAVIGPLEAAAPGAQPASPAARPLSLRSSASCLIPDSTADMGWTIGDHGFEMSLSSRVPDLIREHTRPWVSEWLGREGLRAADVGAWAVHPGGPRILDAAAESLALPADALHHSREVLADHGNMSSPTILFILDRLRRAPAPRPIAALAFGPGIMAEGLLLG